MRPILRDESHKITCPQNWLTLPSWSANFDDTASNAVSSRLSGLFQLGNFFIFPLMTNAFFTQRCGLEPRRIHFMRSLKCGKHTCRMKILRFSKIKNSKLSSGYFTIQQKRGRQAVHASLPLFILLSPNYWHRAKIYKSRALRMERSFYTVSVLFPQPQNFVIAASISAAQAAAMASSPGWSG